MLMEVMKKGSTIKSSIQKCVMEQGGPRGLLYMLIPRTKAAHVLYFMIIPFVSR